MIEPGSEDITITRAHLHQLGTLEGRSKGRESGGRESRDKDSGTGAGVRIAPGTRRISVLDTKIHNIFGTPVEVIPPEQYAADPALPPAAELTIEDDRFAGEQEKWW